MLAHVPIAFNSVAQSRTLTAVDPATGARITRRTARPILPADIAAHLSRFGLSLDGLLTDNNTKLIKGAAIARAVVLVAFAALVTGPPPDLQLDRACALMSAAFTGADHTHRVMTELDQLASMVVDPSLRGVLAAMRGRVTGNRDHYYDPRNSFIDEVLRRGLGLPITLSVVAIEIGRRAGVPIVGIGLPGHFMVRDAAHDVYGDPFHEGAVYDRAGVVAARATW